MQGIYLYFKGLAMGAADVVPGVSGGTIAFITGIYQELIEAIRSVTGQGFVTLRKEGVAAAWKAINGNFLLILFAGILTSILSLAQGLNYLLETQPIMVWSFFFGLILASAWLIGKSVQEWSPFTILLGLLGLAIAYYITIAAPAETSHSPVFLFLAGSIAICAMILPGISGSFILLLLGQYRYIIESISEFRISVLLLFASGCLLGLLSFARLLSWMFKHYPNGTVAVLTGFMLGSLNKVWPWKETLTTTVDRHGDTIPLTQRSVSPAQFDGAPEITTAVLAALLGLALILLLEWRNGTSSKRV